MNKNMPVSEFAKMVPELLKENKTISFCPNGESMSHTINSGDTVILAKPDNLSKYDIVLFLKDGEKAILHRIIAKNSDGTYTMRGDSQSHTEDGIKQENIVAKVVCIIKNGKKIKTTDLRFYVKSFIILHLKYIKRALIR